jgi:hypothetical protein
VDLANLKLAAVADVTGISATAEVTTADLRTDSTVFGKDVRTGPYPCNHQRVLESGSVAEQQKLTIALVLPKEMTCLYNKEKPRNSEYP